MNFWLAGRLSLIIWILIEQSRWSVCSSGYFLSGLELPIQRAKEYGVIIYSAAVVDVILKLWTFLIIVINSLFCMYPCLGDVRWPHAPVVGPSL